LIFFKTFKNVKTILKLTACIETRNGLNLAMSHILPNSDFVCSVFVFSISLILVLWLSFAFVLLALDLIRPLI
jgi:hypothetical protein